MSNFTPTGCQEDMVVSGQPSAHSVSKGGKQMIQVKHIKYVSAFSLILLILASAPASLYADSMQLSNDNGTAEYQHPQLAGSGSTFGTVVTPIPDWSSCPVQVESVELMLLKLDGGASSATVRAHIYSITDGQPDKLLGSSASTIITTFWPNWASISLGLANITLPPTEPFMVAFEYVNATPNSSPALLTDTQDSIPVAKNFYSFDAGASWTEHYDFWTVPEAIGYNMVRVTVNDTPDCDAYLPSVLRNWAPLPTPPPPDSSELSCLYALNWWRNPSPPYNIIRSDYIPPCLKATDIHVEHIIDNIGRQTAYIANVKRLGEPDFDMRADYIFNNQGGVEGADVTKTYVGGNKYQMRITQFCPKVGQLVGYKVRVNSQEIIVGNCP